MQPWLNNLIGLLRYVPNVWNNTLYFYLYTCRWVTITNEVSLCPAGIIPVCILNSCMSHRGQTITKGAAPALLKCLLCKPERLPPLKGKTCTDKLLSQGWEGLSLFVKGLPQSITPSQKNDDKICKAIQEIRERNSLEGLFKRENDT